MANTPTTDLNDVYLEGATNWDELSGFAAGAAANENLESFIQGSSCVSQQVSTNKTGAASGLQYDNTADITAFTDNTDVFLFWWQFLFPEALNDYNETVGQTAPSSNSPGTASGYFVGIGSSTGNANYWAVGGADYGRYPYGGWQNVAIDPTRSASWTDGSPTASNYRYFNYLPNIASAPSRGQSNVADAIRYGRGTIIFTGGSPAGTFEDVASANDASGARWGLFQDQAGSYLWKGRIQLGTSGSSLLFEDTNKNIACDATRQVMPTFNLIEVNNTASDITWTNISIRKLTGLATLDIDSSRGDFQMNDNATLTKTGCVFTDMGYWNYEGVGGNTVTLDRVTYRRCNLVRQNGSTVQDCIFDVTNDSVHALHVSDSANDLSLVTGCNFTAAANRSNHAIRLGPVTKTKTVSFTDNTLSGYTNGSTGTFVGSTGTDSSAIEVNVSTGETLTINVTGTSSTPSIQNLGAGTVIVQAAITTTISGVLGASEVKVLPTSGSPLSNNALNDTLGIATETVSADMIQGDGTNYFSYSNNNGKVRLNAVGTASFSGVLTDGDLSATPLDSGDTVCVFIRDNEDNPTLQLADEFIVATNGTGQGAPSASSIDTNQDFATFSSIFDTVLDASNSKMVSVERKDARYQFSVSSGQQIDFQVFRKGSTPVVTTGQVITSDNSSFPISQSADINYNDPV